MAQFSVEIICLNGLLLCGNQLAGVPIAKNAAVFEAGLDFNISPNTTLGIAYQGQFSSGASDQDVKGLFKVNF